MGAVCSVEKSHPSHCKYVPHERQLSKQSWLSCQVCLPSKVRANACQPGCAADQAHLHCKHMGGAVQVMLAQQESIAHLMSLYEAVRMEGPSASQASQPQLQAVKQESSLGKACLKQDRSAWHKTGLKM